MLNAVLPADARNPADALRLYLDVTRPKVMALVVFIAAEST